MDGLRDTLRRTGGINAVATELGLPATEASVLVEALLPVLIGALHLHCRNAGGGEDGCRATIDLLHRYGGGALAAAIMAPEASDPASGRKLLEALLSGPVGAVAVNTELTRRCGLKQPVLDAILPRLAMLVGGYVAASAAEQQGVCRLDDLIGTAGCEDELAEFLTAAGARP